MEPKLNFCLKYDHLHTRALLILQSHFLSRHELVFDIKELEVLQHIFIYSFHKHKSLLCARPCARGLLWELSGKESGCQWRRHKRCRFDPWVGKIPWKRKRPPTPGFLPGKSHGQRSLTGYSSWGQEGSDTTEQWSTQKPTVLEDKGTSLHAAYYLMRGVSKWVNRRL